MKINSNIGLTRGEANLQFSFEFELDENNDPKDNEIKTKNAAAAFRNMINEVMTFPLQEKSKIEVKEAKELSMEKVTASPSQIKYLNDLTRKCNTTLHKWCQSKGVDKNRITPQHCQEWIPELQQKAKGNDYF